MAWRSLTDLEGQPRRDRRKQRRWRQRYQSGDRNFDIIARTWASLAAPPTARREASWPRASLLTHGPRRRASQLAASIACPCMGFVGRAAHYPQGGLLVASTTARAWDSLAEAMAARASISWPQLMLHAGMELAARTSPACACLAQPPSEATRMESPRPPLESLT
ncbi:hypothetical protein Dimus_020173 [Dionaea muscipula]